MQILTLTNIMDSNHKSLRQTELSVLFLCQTIILFVQRRAQLLFNPFYCRCDDGNEFSSSIVQTVWITVSALAEQAVSHAVFASWTIWDSKSFREMFNFSPLGAPLLTGGTSLSAFLPSYPLPVLEYLLLFRNELSEAPPHQQHPDTSSLQFKFLIISFQLIIHSMLLQWLFVHFETWSLFFFNILVENMHHMISFDVAV